jgi:hypothetical protein
VGLSYISGHSCIILMQILLEAARMMTAQLRSRPSSLMPDIVLISLLQNSSDALPLTLCIGGNLDNAVSFGKEKRIIGGLKCNAEQDQIILPTILPLAPVIDNGGGRPQIKKNVKKQTSV